MINDENVKIVVMFHLLKDQTIQITMRIKSEAKIM